MELHFVPRNFEQPTCRAGLLRIEQRDDDTHVFQVIDRQSLSPQIETFHVQLADALRQAAQRMDIDKAEGGYFVEVEY